jgi:hypothetical protein
VWKQASEFHYTCDKKGPMVGIEQARMYLMRGIRAYKDSLDVYIWVGDVEFILIHVGLTVDDELVLLVYERIF